MLMLRIILKSFRIEFLVVALSKAIPSSLKMCLKNSAKNFSACQHFFCWEKPEVLRLSLVVQTKIKSSLTNPLLFSYIQVSWEINLLLGQN
ncbi:MAG: hypothetical protein DRJ06_01525 [Candidatus Aminicenantes bacterium]|nr:MAG: hypothetical protein DRJ06_01525 [Candidatus Aminicenantes bacterium]